jgi:hypothetical protein
MVGPDQPAKLGSHRSNLPAVGKEVLDCEGFFITLPNPEFNVRKLGTGSIFTSRNHLQWMAWQEK